ncbi:hypothetical protein BOX15_Mlig001822g2 [Macrostomum lignano]|uniref:Uncharacterized protein n=1 Tax=Macrostomum lignano TaxID=282301 RepID=A0A267E8Z9_9PLAT|nr:hypothetical protein BOX15_Mlig001822g2 [Macrostomum lignano]
MAMRQLAFLLGAACLVFLGSTVLTAEASEISCYARYAGAAEERVTPCGDTRHGRRCFKGVLSEASAELLQEHSELPIFAGDSVQHCISVPVTRSTC